MRVRPVAGLVLGVLASLVLAAPAVALAGRGASAGLVDTRNGTLGPGFPEVAAGVPFGMIAPGPDTSLPDGSADPVNYVGYSYGDPNIRGFSLTHFDGAGIHIAGDLPFMPTTGAVSPSDPLSNSSPYQHATEVAKPGYYAVTLVRYRIRAELTATARAAMMRFTFPRTTQANVLAEVTRSINGTQAGSATAVGDHVLEGWVKSGAGYKLYFSASFDHAFRDTPDATGAQLSFDTTTDPTVTMRVGISYVDLAGAEHNLASELPSTRSFDQVKAAAVADWNRHLGDVAVTGGRRADRATFYDNLYRSMLLPTLFDDADGRYLGFDGQIHTVAAGHHQYTGLSLWDIYRSQLPLLELVEPSVAHDILASLIADAQQNHGVIPRWVQGAADRGIMGGDSGSATLADGATEGLLTPAEARQALALLVAQATTIPPVWPRERLDADQKYGYIPNDIDGIGTSLTLEYAIDDQAVSALAAALGDQTEAAALSARAGNWRHLVDPTDHFIRPRNANGSWADPSQLGDPSGVTGLSTGVSVPYSPNLQDGYQEGTGWQYLWSVPQDPAGLAAAIGGRSVAVRRLDRFFSTALNQPLAPAVPLAQEYGSFFGVYYVGGQYTPANEPDLWAPWFYDFYGQPWKAQKVVRAEMSAYDGTPAGLPGNDDAGEMSAWYVLAALGIYHAAPGVDAWELSSPAFPRATLRTGGRALTIVAPSASRADPYVSALRLNDAPVIRTFLTSCELRGGGELRFTLARVPSRSWGTAPGAAPPSASAVSKTVAACTAKLAGGAR